MEAIHSPAEACAGRPKSARSATHSVKIVSFRPFAVPAGAHRRIGAFFHLENRAQNSEQLVSSK
jgi:hypothetical protein